MNIKTISFLRIAMTVSLMVSNVALFAQQPADGRGGAPAGVTPGGGPPGGGRGGRGPGRAPLTINFTDNTGFTQIFDGKSIDNWKGVKSVWRVEEGNLVGEFTKGTGGAKSFLYLQENGADVIVGDLEFKCEIKLGQGNTGVHYRSHAEPAKDWGDESNTGGYQIDFAANAYGQFYEGYGRGVTTSMGQVVLLGPEGKRTLVSTLGSNEELKSVIKEGEWNEMHLIVRGNTFTHIINGRVMSITIDDDAAKYAAKGIFAVQIESGNSLAKVSFRNMYLKKL
jgi:hypothetical protein